MTTALESAFPLNSNWPAATVRSKLAEAMVGVFPTADLSGEDFSIQPYPAIAVYGPDGDLTFYAFDATDTVTADDGGISCIVVSGRRYKRSGEVIVRDAALSATTTGQPVSPSLGDTYIVPAAPSGDDWASQAKTVATFTARGWMFRQPFVGMMVYVEDEDAIYHYDSSGDWIAGLPIGAIQDRSIGGKKLREQFYVHKVEDERNTPPGSPPTEGTKYQIGTSPTGAWAGHDREMAEWRGGGWIFYAPEGDGDMIYRRDLNRLFFHISGEWTSGSGIDDQIFDANGTWTRPIAASDDALVFVQVWGAGGGGGGPSTEASGGGGGGYHEGYFRLGDLTTSVTVLVAPVTPPGAGGGKTSFGSYLEAYGGGAGTSIIAGGGGGGGGITSPGGAGPAGAGGGPAWAAGNGGLGYGGAGSPGNSPEAAAGARWGGGGGGGGNNMSGVIAAGGPSIYGGGGGGGGAGPRNNNTSGGNSTFGGNGGKGYNSLGPAENGQTPGGGGGGGGTPAGSGGSGRCRVRVIG